MRFAIVGSGAVGGYYGAKLARAGHEVTFLARGDHLAAIRERGLTVKSSLGDFTVQARAEDDPAKVPPVDVALFTVKAYSNRDALPSLKAVMRDQAVVLTLQNGVDSIEEIAAHVGEARTLGGATYIAASRSAPGLVEQTGSHRRIVFGEAFGDPAGVSERVRRISDALSSADIVSEPAANARVPIWEKFCFLSPFAAFTGAARLPIGPLWADDDVRGQMIAAFGELEAVAKAEGVALAPGIVDRIVKHVDTLPPTTRSSLLIDLQLGKPIEVEALLGTVVRRGARANVSTPILAALYAVLKPHAGNR